MKHLLEILFLTIVLALGCSSDTESGTDGGAGDGGLGGTAGD